MTKELHTEHQVVKPNTYYRTRGGAKVFTGESFESALGTHFVEIEHPPSHTYEGGVSFVYEIYNHTQPANLVFPTGLQPNEHDLLEELPYAN